MGALPSNDGLEVVILFLFGTKDISCSFSFHGS